MAYNHVHRINMLDSEIYPPTRIRSVLVNYGNVAHKYPTRTEH